MSMKIRLGIYIYIKAKQSERWNDQNNWLLWCALQPWLAPLTWGWDQPANCPWTLPLAGLAPNQHPRHRMGVGTSGQLPVSPPPGQFCPQLGHPSPQFGVGLASLSCLLTPSQPIPNRPQLVQAGQTTPVHKIVHWDPSDYINKIDSSLKGSFPLPYNILNYEKNIL